MNTPLSDTAAQEQWAKVLYTQLQMTLPQVALEVGASEACIRGWISANGWDALKRGKLTTRQQQLENLYWLLEHVTARLKKGEDASSKDADLAVKYTAAIKNLDTELGLGEIIEVAKAFTKWILNTDRAMAQQVTLLFDGFIKWRLASTET